jgi:hypothetical protein
MHCEGCRHALFDSEKQIGCKYSLSSKLGAEIVNDDLYYSLDKVCLYKNKKDSEIDIKLGYLFILKNINQKDVLIHNIKRIIDKKPLWVGISAVSEDLNKLDDIKNQLISLLDGVCQYKIIVNAEDYSDYYKLDQFMNDYKNGWTYVNEVGDFFRENAKEVLSQFILVNAGKAAVISGESEQVNDTCFYNFIFKCLHGNKTDFNEENEKFYFKNFYDKVEEKDPKMILDWSDLQ